MTWLSLAILLVVYPGLSLIGLGQDYSALFANMTQGVLLFLLITTILFQWGIFLINYSTTYLEGTGLAGLGLKPLRMVDFAWGLSFMLASYAILSGLAWLMARIGLPLSGEIRLLVPEGVVGKIVWVLVSFTAGFCEEIGFRGYVMSRLRILGRFRGWLWPSVISAIAFGSCHVYQGVAGFILIAIYGLMFSALYIRTGRLWPCIIAHSLWDLGALFYPR